LLWVVARAVIYFTVSQHGNVNFSILHFTRKHVEMTMSC
jgi:hypothetical protein